MPPPDNNWDAPPCKRNRTRRKKERKKWKAVSNEQKCICLTEMVVCSNQLSDDVSSCHQDIMASNHSHWFSSHLSTRMREYNYADGCCMEMCTYDCRPHRDASLQAQHSFAGKPCILRDACHLQHSSGKYRTSQIGGPGISGWANQIKYKFWNLKINPSWRQLNICFRKHFTFSNITKNSNCCDDILHQNEK